MSANSPNPLVPQGSLEKQTSKAKSNVKVAVYSIVAVHAVLIFGVLMQGGCKKDEPKVPATDTISGQPAAPASSDPFYTGNSGDAPGRGPSTAPAPAAATPAPATDPFAATPTTPVTTPVTSPVTAGTNPTAPTVDPGMAPVAALPEAAGPVQQYKVVKGDVFYTIAKKNKTTVAKLTAANPGIDPAKLKIGQTLNIPASAAAPASAPATTAAAAPDASVPAAAGNTTTYVVKSGDTLFGISKKTGASVKAIRTANNMKTDRINVGTKLKIPVKATAAAAPTPEPVITAPASVTPPPAPMTTTSAPVTTPIRPRG
jgi:LysM repeat protein